MSKNMYLEELEAKIKAIDNKIEAEQDKRQKNVLSVAKKLMRNDYDILYVADCLYFMNKVFKQYVGKKYGEKTKQAIYEELKDKYNMVFVIKNANCNIYTISVEKLVNGFTHCNSRTINLNDFYFDNDNKIKDIELTIAKNGLYCKTFDNYLASAKSIVKAYENYEKQLHILNIAIEDLRVLTSNITTINNCIYTSSKGNCNLF